MLLFIGFGASAYNRKTVTLVDPSNFSVNSSGGGDGTRNPLMSPETYASRPTAPPTHSSNSINPHSRSTGYGSVSGGGGGSGSSGGSGGGNMFAQQQQGYVPVDFLTDDTDEKSNQNHTPILTPTLTPALLSTQPRVGLEMKTLNRPSLSSTSGGSFHTTLEEDHDQSEK